MNSGIPFPRLRIRGRLILFVLLSLFLVTQAAWWVIFTNRSGERIASLQREVWEQEIATARQWISQHQSIPPDSLAFAVHLLFPDVVYHPEDRTFSVSADAQERLEDQTVDVTRMFAMESSVFLVLIFGGMIYMYWTLRREAYYERQYANFLAAVTHELRSPVAAIRLLQDSLADEQLKPDQKAQVIVSMRSSVDRLQALIDRLLKTRELAGGKRHLIRMEETDLAVLTRQAVHEIVAGKPSEEQRIRLEIPEETRARVDAEHWRLLVANLVDNALKYSDGEVDIKLDQANGKVRLSVRDQGKGIPAREQRKIFRRFYRIGHEETRGSQGSGLGLYLVREIARSLGGHVTVHSAGSNKGAEFTVTLPAV